MDAFTYVVKLIYICPDSLTHFRAAEDDKKFNDRKEKNTEHMRFVRENESSPARKSRLLAEQHRICQRRIAKTSEEHKRESKTLKKETQEEYEDRLNKQRLRQQKLRKAETKEQHQLRILEQAKRQKRLRAEETEQQWSDRLDLQRDSQRKYRLSMPEEKKMQNGKKIPLKGKQQEKIYQSKKKILFGEKMQNTKE